MEFGFLALVLASAGIGLFCRAKVSPSTGRLFLAAGVTALALGLLVLALTIIRWGPFGTWAAGLISVVFFMAAAAALPFAVAVGAGRRVS